MLFMLIWHLWDLLKEDLEVALLTGSMAINAISLISNLVFSQSSTKRPSIRPRWQSCKLCTRWAVIYTEEERSLLGKLHISRLEFILRWILHLSTYLKQTEFMQDPRFQAWRRSSTITSGLSTGLILLNYNRRVGLPLISWWSWRRLIPKRFWQESSDNAWSAGSLARVYP